MSRTKLSGTMLRVLIDIVEGRGTHHQCWGRSEAGARPQVLISLRARGLIDDKHQATDDGKELARIKQTKCASCKRAGDVLCAGTEKCCSHIFCDRCYLKHICKDYRKATVPA